jgi:UDP-glucuronate decarboxylase
MLVTGGAGFLGSHICEHFVARGWQVEALDNLTTGRRSNTEQIAHRANFRFIESDVREPFSTSATTLLNFASPASPTVYQNDPIATAMTNALGSYHILELARRTGARVVQASTSEIYGDPDVSPQSEMYWGRVNPLGPRACYNESKRFAEAIPADYRRKYGLHVALIRIFNTYGPRMREDDGRVISNFITAALTNAPLLVHGDGHQTRSFCYVSDFVTACDALLNHSPDIFGPLNIGNPEEVSIIDLANLVIDLVGSNSRVEYLPAADDDPRQRCPDIGAAQAQIGWSPQVALRTGLGRTIEYFEKELMLEGA